MMRTIIRAISYLSLLIIATVTTTNLSATPSGNRVSVVVGDHSPELEKFSASELCGYLDKLFGLKLRPTTSPAASSSAVFLVGTQASNSRIKTLPKIGEQGIVIQRAESETPTLIVSGGSSKAVLWSVYELAERWGVRYLLDR